MWSFRRAEGSALGPFGGISLSVVPEARMWIRPSSKRLGSEQKGSANEGQGDPEGHQVGTELELEGRRVGHGTGHVWAACCSWGLLSDGGAGREGRGRGWEAFALGDRGPQWVQPGRSGALIPLRLFEGWL